MTRVMSYFGVMVLVCILCSCSWFSKKPAPPDPKQVATDQADKGLTRLTEGKEPVNDITKVDSSRVNYRKNDITFKIKADPQLNKFQNGAHTLLLCLYQLKDPNAFNQLAEEKGTIPRLLECSRFDSSVANSKRLSVQPGQEINEVRDRAEGTRFIGVATGYFGLDRMKVTALVPLAIHNGELSGQDIVINLGPYEIDSIMVK